MKNTTRIPGQTLVEFALTIPLVLLLLLGFFDLGRAVFYYSSLSNAVREGARRGIVIKTSEGDLQDIVLDYAFGLTSTTPPLTADDIVVSTGGYDENNISLRISASYCFVPITPGISLIVGNNCTDGAQGILLTAVSEMRFEAGIWK